jgi:micrococcal nuclease
MHLRGKPAVIFGTGLAVGGLVGYEVGLSNNDQPKAPAAETTTILQEQIVGSFLVSTVTDGDTVKVVVPGQKDAVIRVLGINAPESKDPRRPVQCFAHEAAAEATRLLLHKTVELTMDPVADSIDSNDRLLRKIDTTIGPGVEDFSHYMVANGFAAAYRRYRSTDRQELIAMEQTARTQHRGLWGSCSISSSNVPKNLSTEVTFPPAD